ncbi:HAD family hydrolase [Salinigranum sp. GCM10025319]|uniref:HAD family hydrolase n=1 Tax=Salinigranum sp. GCM10025319 TaxID=3252687 RepID=UPI0036142021
MAVSFDLFGTLVDVERPADPAVVVADELRARDVAVPGDFVDAYREPQIDAPDGAEVPLPAHVGSVLRAHGVEAPGNAVRRAVVAAFDPDVRTRQGAADAVAAACDRGPVGLLSNCSVPELVGRTLIRSDLSRDRFDSIVTSVGCGWRKPAPEAFETVADGLDVAPDALVHVGDSPATDGGIEPLGGTFVDVSEVPLVEFPAWLAARTDEGDRETRTDGGRRRRAGGQRHECP